MSPTCYVRGLISERDSFRYYNYRDQGDTPSDPRLDIFKRVRTDYSFVLHHRFRLPFPTSRLRRNGFRASGASTSGLIRASSHCRSQSASKYAPPTPTRRITAAWLPSAGDRRIRTLVGQVKTMLGIDIDNALVMSSRRLLKKELDKEPASQKWLDEARSQSPVHHPPDLAAWRPTHRPQASATYPHI